MSLFSKVCLLIALAVVCILPLQAQDSPNVAPKDKSVEETCVVSGMVVAKPDGAPLKGATIHLRSDEDRGHTIAAKSGADGKFELKNVPAAQYHLEVSRNGYFEMEYGQEKPGDPGAVLSLRPGDRKTDLLFRMGRAGVIIGHVFDEDGEAMPRVIVSALKTTYDNGRPELRPVRTSQSDDLGEFRIFGLPPGRYYISAECDIWDHVMGEREFSAEGKNSGEKGYEKTYYPNAFDPGKASMLTVKEGEEIPAIDFLMKETAVYRIRGKVVNLVSKQGRRPSWVSGYRRNQSNDWVELRSDKSPGSDGAFEFAEVPPGEYTIVGIVFDDNRALSTQEDVDVTTADINGLVLVVGPGVTIPGVVHWEGKPALNNEETSIVLHSSQMRSAGGAYAHVDQNWQFTLKDVPEGNYKIELNGTSKDCYIKEVRLGDTIMPDTELRVKGGVGTLEVDVSSRGAEVDGVVLDSDDLPATGVWVVAVPEEDRRKYPRLYKSTQTDQYGHYELHGLAQGKYKLFGWQSIDQNAWQDSDFLKQYEDKGESVEVQDGDKSSKQLRIILAKDSSGQSD